MKWLNNLFKSKPKWRYPHLVVKGLEEFAATKDCNFHYNTENNDMHVSYKGIREKLEGLEDIEEIIEQEFYGRLKESLITALNNVHFRRNGC